jgi:ABC-2 type transport system ATP-binding protein
MQIAYIYNMDKIKAKNEIEKYAKIFSLFDDLNKKLTSMSSGQRKRVMIISALIHNPQILIMDEPTENLDPDNRKVFYDVLKKFISDGKTIFISTHNLDEIEKHIDYAIIISNGEIKYQGTVKKGYGELTKIYEKYKN